MEIGTKTERLDLQKGAKSGHICKDCKSTAGGLEDA